MDGTLCDSDPFHFRAFQELLQQVRFVHCVSVNASADSSSCAYSVSDTLIQSFIWPHIQIGFNDGVPITEEFYSATISGVHNENLAGKLFPDMDHDKAVKFLDDKEALFRKYATRFTSVVSTILLASPSIALHCKIFVSV